MTAVTGEAQVQDFVRAARADGAPFEIVAGGTRRAVGRPMARDDGEKLPLLDVSGLSGILKYEPEELVVTVAPATPLAELRAVLAERNQCLGFDPADWSAVLGSNGAATLGGAMSADAFGPGRLRHGAARDSLLGFRGVNGMGESFRAGSKVVKNVTGFDVPKLVCGAFGTLCVLTELTFRVYPRASHAITLCLADMTPEAGFAALRKIARSALEPAGLFYFPGTSLAAGIGLGEIGLGAAVIRLEGAEAPLAQKVEIAHGLIGQTQAIADGDGLLDTVRSGALFAGSDLDVWRVSLPPSEAPHVAAALAPGVWLGDLAGGLLWIGAQAAEAARIREVAAAHDGHAMLLRASPEARAALGIFAPQPPALAAMARNVKAAFDPLDLFNPGRL
jgi:glycolate oxidase FAD binding subunit